MRSSTFKAAGCVVFIFCLSVFAQNPIKKTGDGHHQRSKLPKAARRQTSILFAGHGQPAAFVNADGSFTIDGLVPGVAQFLIKDRNHTKDYEIARVERNGELLARGVEIKAREKISGIRFVLRNRNSAIRGMVKFENGQVENTEIVYVYVQRVADDTFNIGTQLDARGRFALEGLWRVFTRFQS